MKHWSNISGKSFKIDNSSDTTTDSVDPFELSGGRHRRIANGDLTVVLSTMAAAYNTIHQIQATSHGMSEWWREPSIYVGWLIMVTILVVKVKNKLRQQ
jgi:hypothetical protein